MTYFEKLRDPRWQKLSARVKEIAGWKCERCGAIDKNLQAHHRCYFPNREPWEYHPAMLQCLCFECHETTTEFNRYIAFMMSHMSNCDVVDFYEYAMELCPEHALKTKA